MLSTLYIENNKIKSVHNEAFTGLEGRLIQKSLVFIYSERRPKNMTKSPNFMKYYLKWISPSITHDSTIADQNFDILISIDERSNTSNMTYSVVTLVPSQYYSFTSIIA